MGGCADFLTGGRMKDSAKIAFVALVLLSFLFVIWIAQPQGEEPPALFFAYGANLDSSTLAARAGGFEGVRLAKLDGYRLAFQTNRNSEFGVANLVQDAEGSVAGALYNLTPAQMAALDRYSNVPKFYEKKRLTVIGADGKGYDAAAYVLAGNAESAVPSGPYLNATMEALAKMGYGQEESASISAAAREALQNNLR